MTGGIQSGVYANALKPLTEREHYLQEKESQAQEQIRQLKKLIWVKENDYNKEKAIWLHKD